ncbi:MAG: hypothetical protein H5T86_16085 [Armatimonadetes bacterium]|nr:hypothetical protein [Armatimonadota bacterium]
MLSSIKLTEQPLASRTFAAWLRHDLCILPENFSPDAVIGAVRPMSPDEPGSWPEQAEVAAEETEGVVCGALHGWLLCCWGMMDPERDDCLRAYLWAARLDRAVTVLAAGPRAIDELRNALLALDRMWPPGPNAFATPSFAARCHALEFAKAGEGLLEILGEK